MEKVGLDLDAPEEHDEEAGDSSDVDIGTLDEQDQEDLDLLGGSEEEAGGKKYNDTWSLGS